MFNFFIKNKQEKIRHNSLDSKSTKPKDVVDNFLKFAKTTTEKRANDFNSLMRFALESNQWTNAELNLKDDEHDSALVFNFSQEYLERYKARLFPRNPHTGVMEVGVKVRESDSSKQQKYESEILDIYYEYALADILSEQSINFLCGGASVFYYPQDPITKRASIFSIDPTKCYLGWAGGKMVQFAFQEYLGDGKYITNYWDLANHIIINEATDKRTSEKNPFNFIPAYWIPNNPRPHSHEGISKIHLLSELDRVYNRTASNFDKRIEENTEPHILITTDMADVSKIERGRKKKTRLGKGDDMKYLELGEGSEIINWLNLIEKRITNKNGIVHSSGALKTNTSGKSLSIQFSDMMDLIGFMRIAWDKAFREMNTAILSYKFKTDKYNTDPVYQPFLAQDNSDRIEQYAKMIENNLISHRDAIDELRGVENAEEKLNEILAEMKLFNDVKPVEKSVNNLPKNKDV
jgi:hypothetical protein